MINPPLMLVVHVAWGAAGVAVAQTLVAGSDSRNVVSSNPLVPRFWVSLGAQLSAALTTARPGRAVGIYRNPVCHMKPCVSGLPGYRQRRPGLCPAM